MLSVNDGIDVIDKIYVPLEVLARCGLTLSTGLDSTIGLLAVVDVVYNRTRHFVGRIVDEVKKSPTSGLVYEQCF